MRLVKVQAFITVIIFCSLLLVNSCTSNQDYYSTDYRIFKNTEVWDLVCEMRDDDLDDFMELVESKKYDLNFQESKFGMTMGHMAILNNKYKFLEILLKYKANPNIRNFNGYSYIILLGEFHDWNVQYEQIEKLKYLKLLVKYGANINDHGLYTNTRGSTVNSVLMQMCQRTFLRDRDTFYQPLFDYLLMNGVDVNYTDTILEDNALLICLVGDDFKALHYLLMHGADYKKVVIRRSMFQPNEKDVYFEEILKENYFHLDSKEYSEKKKIIEFLDSVGGKYRKLSVPERELELIKEDYPNNWQEVVKVY
jgi:hypothetical protein